MIRFLLILFTVVIFFLLATQLLIHDHQTQWAEGAVSAFAASFIVADSVAFVRQRT